MIPHIYYIACAAFLFGMAAGMWLVERRQGKQKVSDCRKCPKEWRCIIACPDANTRMQIPGWLNGGNSYDTL